MSPSWFIQRPTTTPKNTIDKTLLFVVITVPILFGTASSITIRGFVVEATSAVPEPDIETLKNPK